MNGTIYFGILFVSIVDGLVEMLGLIIIRLGDNDNDNAVCSNCLMVQSGQIIIS